MIVAVIVVLAAIVMFIAVCCAFAWYRIVPANEAHLVITPNAQFVVSPDDKLSTEGKKTYFEIPSYIPFVGRSIRHLDVSVREIVQSQETYEKEQARYSVRSSTKFKVVDARKAAQTFTDDAELAEQLKEVINASVRAVTVQYDVTQARSKKKEMEEKIREEMNDDLKQWGLELVNFQLVDFQDTKDSSIISDISKRREVEINSTTREQNAEKIKNAKMKEFESEELSGKREIEKNKVLGEQQQIAKSKVSEQEKMAQEKQFDVLKVQTIKQADINKEKLLIETLAKQEAEKINAETKRQEGLGDRDRSIEQATGKAKAIELNGQAEAFIIKAKGEAEAIAKDKLQSALNKFSDAAIKALVAEKVVAAQQAIGVASAEALKTADVKVFSGGNDSSGFDLGKMISSMQVSDSTTADAILNKLARPNDLGFVAKAISEVKPKK